MEQTLEKRVAALEETLQQLQHENHRLSAVVEIQNLLSSYEFYHTAGLHSKTAELFSKSQDVCIAMDGVGNFEGSQGVSRMFNKLFAVLHGGDRRGTLRVHAITTPVIQVAADGQSAKGVWISPGHETEKDRETGAVTGYWVWSYYECTFVREEGSWKFLRFAVHPIFKTPYDTCWTDTQYLPPQGPPLPKEIGPDTPNPKWTAYARDKAPQLDPVPPEPYDTLEPRSI